MTPLQRIMFLQGQTCFFCKCDLPPGDASLDYLVPASRGGSDHPDNLVACCKSLNALFGDMGIKEKICVILKQKGEFICPNQPKSNKGNQPAPPSQPTRPLPPSASKPVTQRPLNPAPPIKREAADFFSPTSNGSNSREG